MPSKEQNLIKKSLLNHLSQWWRYIQNIYQVLTEVFFVPNDDRLMLIAVKKMVNSQHNLLGSLMSNSLPRIQHHM